MVHIFKLILIFERKDSVVVGSIFGDFKITPQTKVLEMWQQLPHSLMLSQLLVSDSGELSIRFDNNDVGIVTYKSKNITQFLDLDGLNEGVLDKEKFLIHQGLMVFLMMEQNLILE